MATHWKRLLKGGAARLAPRRGAQRFPGVPGRVHPQDAMLFDESEASLVNYVRAGRSAMENLRLALAETGRDFSDVSSCLDFGCGHGRVLRLLAEEIPPACITACDLDAQGVRFCAAEFGVRPLISKPDLGTVGFSTYDLIWSGSVITHLEPASAEDFLRILGGTLEPGGILVFSTHGEHSLANLEHFYGASHAHEAGEIRREVAETGVSYRSYGTTFSAFQPERYGMAWHSREFVTSTVERLFGGEVRLLLFRPQGWDHHHDVFAFRRVD